jgi:hypothetical protein
MSKHYLRGLQVKIDELRQEIKSFEIEIEKLQQQLVVAGGRTLQLATGNSPSDISQFVQAEAKRIVDNQPVLRGLKDAIVELNNRLAQKKVEFQELEAVELKQSRKKRIEEGQQKLRAKVRDVGTAAQSLESLYFELKAITAEYEQDFNCLYPPTPSRQMLNRTSLLNFGLLTIPTLTENDGQFLLNSQALDVFESEKAALQKQRQEASRRSQQNHDDMMAQLRQREADEKLRTEREYRASLLISKRQELKDFVAARSDRLLTLKTADVGGFDSAIAKLQEEIENLESMQG